MTSYPPEGKAVDSLVVKSRLDILKGESAQVTHSELDSIVSGHFAYLDFSNHTEFLDELEGARCLLVRNSDSLDHEGFDPSLDKEHVEARVSAESLALIKLQEQDRYVAQDDQNQIKFSSMAFPELSQKLAASLMDLLKPERKLQLWLSGRNWYPKRGYMGWHTNSNVKGFRLYCSHAAAGNASYFRYQDPVTAEVITSWDHEGWNFRCFRTDREPLWHCVNSETDRVSFGYTLRFPPD